MSSDLPPERDRLRFSTCEDGVLVPSASRGWYRGIDGAVFDADHRPIEASLLTRTWVDGRISFPPDISDLDARRIDVVDEPHIYGGYFFDHFGHFLLESLARTWVVEEVGRLPFVWASGGPPNRWQQEILDLLGLDVVHRFPSRPTRYRELVIAEPGFRIQGQFHERHADFLARVPPSGAALPRERVWLSRSGPGGHRRSRGEPALEATLRANGWRIHHPEDVEVRTQIDVLAGAEVVAGLEGSGFHAAVLVQGRCAPLVVLRRTRNANYAAIADRRAITEIDLFGAFRILDRQHIGLIRPRRTARTLIEIADRMEGAGDDPVALQALQHDYERRFSFERWQRRQRWRVAAHAATRGRAALTRVGRKIRWLRQRWFGRPGDDPL